MMTTRFICYFIYLPTGIWGTTRSRSSRRGYFQIYFPCDRGVARIFPRGRGGGAGVTEATRYVKQGHHPGISDYIWFIPLLSLVCQRVQSYYCGMKAHINVRQEPLTKILYKKTNFKKVGFSTVAFTAKILSWRFRHLNIVGCLLKRRPTKGGS